jgi:hypothetical protein
MISWQSSGLVFLLAILPSMVLAVVVHEAGHVIAARLVGRQILAWGIGFQKPWFRARCGRSVFYAGFPLTSGVTIACHRLLEREPLADFLFVLGGPAATVGGLLAGVAAWNSGWKFAPVVAWIAVSAMFSISSLIPFTIRMGVLRLENDARRLIDILRYGRQCPAYPLGPSLSNSAALSRLLEQVGCAAGAAFFQSIAACLQAPLGDLEAARENLKLGQAGVSTEISSSGAVAALARASIAVEANEDDAKELCDVAAELCRADDTAIFTLDCLREQWRLGRGGDVSDVVNELRQRASVATRNDWLCIADLLDFEADPDGPSDVRCRELLSRHRRYLSGVAKIRLLALTTERLVAAGAIDDARVFFAEAQSSIVAEAATIASPTTRQAYVRQAAAPLQRALQASTDIPLFIGDPPNNLAPRKESAAFVAVALVVMSIATAFMFLGLVANVHDPHSAESTEGSLVAGTFFWLIGLACMLAAVFRREKRGPILATCVVLALLGFWIVLAAILGDFPTRRDTLNHPAWRVPK